MPGDLKYQIEIYDSELADLLLIAIAGHNRWPEVYEAMLPRNRCMKAIREFKNVKVIGCFKNHKCSKCDRDDRNECEYWGGK